MPLLGALVLASFTALVDFFVAFLTREVALRVAFGVLMVAGVATLAASVSAGMALLTHSLPEGLAEVFLFVFPGNVTECLAFVVATEAGCAGYRAYLLGFGR